MLRSAAYDGTSRQEPPAERCAVFGATPGKSSRGSFFIGIIKKYAKKRIKVLTLYADRRIMKTVKGTHNTPTAEKGEEMKRNITDRSIDALEDVVKRGIDPEIAAFLHNVPYDPPKADPETLERWDALTDEEKADTIAVDGKTYVRKIYEDNAPARRLHEMRLKRGMTQKELSERAGLNLRTLQDYEQGKKRLAGAAAETVGRLALALSVTVEYLLDLRL